MLNIKIIKILFAGLALCMIVAQPVAAGEALVNSEAEVDVTGKDASDAKEEAMAKAELDALSALLSKLAPPGQTQEIIDKMDPRKLASLVRGTEVLEESISDNRYRARIMVSFDADAISQIITKVSDSKDEDFVAPTTNAFLIIPSYEEKKKEILLWDDNNLWWQVWKALAVETLSGDVIVPVGDTSDRIVVDGETLSAATYSSLSPFAIRYGVSDIVVLSATYTSKPDMVLNVVKRRINRVRNEVNMLTYRADPQETQETLFQRAARDIASSLSVKKVEEGDVVKGTYGGERNKVMMLASISTLKSWVRLRDKLTSLSMIDRVEVLAISPTQVDMTIYYRGSPESLAAALDSMKLKLGRHKDYWVITGD
ncbi:MAG: DUF2066 domain-containing protein [Alphaproteobacteria bacterium]